MRRALWLNMVTARERGGAGEGLRWMNEFEGLGKRDSSAIHGFNGISLFDQSSIRLIHPSLSPFSTKYTK